MSIARSDKMGTVRQCEPSCQTSSNPLTIGAWIFDNSCWCPLKLCLCDQIDLARQKGLDDTGH